MVRFFKQMFSCCSTDQTAKTKSKGVTFDLNLNNTTDELAQKVQTISLNDSDSGVGSHNSSAVGANSQEFGDEFDGEFNTGSAGIDYLSIPIP